MRSVADHQADAPRVSVLLRTTDRPGFLSEALTSLRGQTFTDFETIVVNDGGEVPSALLESPPGRALRVVVPAARRESLKASLEKYLIMEDAELELGTDVVAMAHGAGWRSVAGEGVLVAEHDELGLGGALVLASSSEALARLDAPRATPAFCEALRVERGVPRFGVDFDESTYPQEAALERRAVSFDKGCYLGQEVVCMLELRGHVKRKLVPVTLEGQAAAGEKVLDESGVEQGALTSVAVGPETGTRVGLAMVKLGRSEAGTRLRVGEGSAIVR